MIGSIRRECLDHVVIFNERHLRHVLASYVDYYHRARTHLSLDKDCPHSRPVQPLRSGRVIAILFAEAFDVRLLCECLRHS
jgi:putative transposase